MISLYKECVSLFIELYKKTVSVSCVASDFLPDLHSDEKNVESMRRNPAHGVALEKSSVNKSILVHFHFFLPECSTLHGHYTDIP